MWSCSWVCSSGFGAFALRVVPGRQLRLRRDAAFAHADLEPGLLDQVRRDRLRQFDVAHAQGRSNAVAVHAGRHHAHGASVGKDRLFVYQQLVGVGELELQESFARCALLLLCKGRFAPDKVVRASRITYVGELGWELYIPAEFALHVFERVMQAGAKHGLKLAGFHALNACRTEKAYRHWGHDVGIEDTPVEAGLAFTCAWDKPGGFIGREAALAQKEQGIPRKRLLQFKLADP
ncbi:MAG: aminomethyl transferase family protein, partial [Betaproteobacteria bacterium]|nr:aminomethyl transferase family protein [Betaproteobacteria bacterium]